MKLTLKGIFLLLAICSIAQIHGQGLTKVCPVSMKKGTMPDSVSFLFTTVDFNLFRGRPLLYAPSIEIVDADMPWPPRWFALHPADTGSDLTTSTRVILNAHQSGNELLFLTIMPQKENSNTIAILRANNNMDIIDTFTRIGKEIDAHDFRLTDKGEMMYFLAHHTTLDLSSKFYNPADSAVDIIYETIEISDAKGKSLFSWDPLKQLGFDAAYMPYRYAQGVMSSNTTFEWSHGNSMELDYDGNILYSFKHIGIGKISRADGHVMWHIDHNKPKTNVKSDAIDLYLQHDLQVVKDLAGDVSYTVFSNGDSTHPFCAAYQFKVSFDEKNEPIVKVIKKIVPAEATPNTGGGGNFDMEADGSYLMNYGIFRQDTTLPQRNLFEYHDEKQKKTIEYSIAPSIFSYRTHKLTANRPARPEISLTEGQLKVDVKGKKAKWYLLEGKDMKKVKYLGEGERFTPKQDGQYCAATPFGIGWAVSRPFSFTKK